MSFYKCIHPCYYLHNPDNISSTPESSLVSPLELSWNAQAQGSRYHRTTYVYLCCVLDRCLKRHMIKFKTSRVCLSPLWHI